ncbi:hypothetical protein Tfer_1507 [Thermincola ferriacetica]|uniref:DUF5666 domain-containing protein n=1 Tax=Thermincola ferriacetica TaxID=281456 RepID=A0A0L6W2X0_9FIRM|nr:hypothetical protein [Thermincola ferriacetica]KNZ69895.1 hypothetical protein Tfer_1507 [Thermincola ferriacetica]
MKKNAPMWIMVGIVVLLAGFLGFKAFQEKTSPQPPVQANFPPKGGEKQTTDPSQEIKEVKQERKKSKIPETDPEQGEIFVEGEVKAVDVEKRILTIDQHMDDNSVSITPNVAVAKDAIIQNKESDVTLGEIKVGDIVGMILTKDRQARAVLVNF